jgi:hypothetical protein
MSPREVTPLESTPAAVSTLNVSASEASTPQVSRHDLQICVAADFARRSIRVMVQVDMRDGQNKQRGRQSLGASQITQRLLQRPKVLLVLAPSSHR